MNIDIKDVMVAEATIGYFTTNDEQVFEVYTEDGFLQYPVFMDAFGEDLMSNVLETDCARQFERMMDNESNRFH